MGCFIESPLWALTHLDGEGQGMGQRTTQGYLFIVNVLFRPALMIFGFILAAFIVDILGRYLFEMYGYALGSAQAESFTGFIAFLCFVGIFMLTGLSIVNIAFNLIHVVPDNVLGWLGGQLQNSLGRSVEDNVNSRTGSAITGVGSQMGTRLRVNRGNPGQTGGPGGGGQNPNGVKCGKCGGNPCQCG